MNELARIFETNRVILYSAYGQVFFVLGLAVLLRPRRKSRLALARSLWLLGSFGILHGISEWAYVFVPIQAEYLPSWFIRLLWLAHTLLETVSFAFLFQFGVALIWPPSKVPRWAHLLPTALFLVWAFLFLYVVTYSSAGFQRQIEPSLFRTGDVLGRYLLALPGAGFVAVGLLREVKTVEAMALPGIVRHLRWAAFSFLAYAVLAGLVVPKAAFFPASILNYDLLWRFFGVPVPVFRSICGLAMAYFVIRALDIFAVETDRTVEEMERGRTVAVERERIGRELHDGTIQSIYAAGLALEDVVYAIGKDPAVANKKVRTVMELLNRTIGDIRTYILDLHPMSDGRQFEQQLCALGHEFADRAGVKASVDVAASAHRPLPPEPASHLLQVAREAFANVAKHAKASRVNVLLTYSDDAITLEISDDGCGFDPRLLAEDYGETQGNGLHNIARRMEVLGGTLRIDSALGKGTRLLAKAPIARVTD